MTVSGGGADVIVYVAVPSAAVQDAAGRAGGLDAFLSPEERNASLRFRRAEDRLDYAASHALFRLLAAWRLGRAPEDAAVLDVRRTCAGCGGTDHGKPSVGGVAVSMSRSHGTVMAVAGPAGASLGADIERVPAEVFAGFDDFALAPEERPGPDGPELTDAGRIRLWVAKEAVLKAAGLGLAVDPSSVLLVPAGSAGSAGSSTAGTLRSKSRGNPAVHGLLVCPVPAPGGYAAAVAATAGLPAQSVSLAEIFATKG
ncbi:4'-phosphopantetheinyl transferase superfamily protein [Micrococcaceae bacterium Sec7.4]